VKPYLNVRFTVWGGMGKLTCFIVGSSLCVAGTTPYHVHTTVTATQDIPPAFTKCHSHGTETYVVDALPIPPWDVSLTLLQFLCNP
jgi:hypothetical protein